jgi:hypothetical protein
MELMCQGRLVARVPALMLEMSVVHAYQQAATAIGQYVEGISRPPDISPLSGAEDMTDEGLATSRGAGP